MFNHNNGEIAYLSFFSGQDCPLKYEIMIIMEIYFDGYKLTYDFP